MKFLLKIPLEKEVGILSKMKTRSLFLEVFCRFYRDFTIHPLVWQKCVVKLDTSPDYNVKTGNFGSSYKTEAPNSRLYADSILFDTF